MQTIPSNGRRQRKAATRRYLSALECGEKEPGAAVRLAISRDFGLENATIQQERVAQ